MLPITVTSQEGLDSHCFISILSPHHFIPIPVSLTHPYVPYPVPMSPILSICPHLSLTIPVSPSLNSHPYVPISSTLSLFPPAGMGMLRVCSIPHRQPGGCWGGPWH